MIREAAGWAGIIGERSWAAIALWLLLMTQLRAVLQVRGLIVNRCGSRAKETSIKSHAKLHLHMVNKVFFDAMHSQRGLCELARSRSRTLLLRQFLEARWS